MDEDADAAEQSRHRQCAGRGLGPVLELGGGLAEDHHQKPDGDQKSSEAGFDQQLQVVVVRLVDEERCVEAAKLRIDDGKCAESPAQEGPLEEHAQAVAIDVNAHSAGDFRAASE